MKEKNMWEKKDSVCRDKGMGQNAAKWGAEKISGDDHGDSQYRCGKPESPENGGSNTHPGSLRLLKFLKQTLILMEKFTFGA